LATREWKVEGGAIVVTLDESVSGRAWDADEECDVPTVLVRLTGWAAAGLAQTLEVYAEVTDALEAARGDESELAAALRAAAEAARPPVAERTGDQ
jgi:hypothetical protein